MPVTCVGEIWVAAASVPVGMRAAPPDELLKKPSPSSAGRENARPAPEPSCPDCSFLVTAIPPHGKVTAWYCGSRRPGVRSAQQRLSLCVSTSSQRQAISGVLSRLTPDIDGQNQVIAVPLFIGGLVKDARQGHDPEPCDGVGPVG